MKVALSSKNKFSFVNGAIKMPSIDDPKYFYWELCNNMVVAWITRVLSPTIARTVLWIDTAEGIWLDLKKRFSKQDVFRIAEIQSEIYRTKQGSAMFTKGDRHYSNNKPKVVCSYCGFTGHTIEKCYKKHGYPPGWKPRGKNIGSANQIHGNAQENCVSVNQDGYKKYLEFIEYVQKERNTPLEIGCTGPAPQANIITAPQTNAILANFVPNAESEDYDCQNGRVSPYSLATVLSHSRLYECSRKSEMFLTTYAPNGDSQFRTQKRSFSQGIQVMLRVGRSETVRWSGNDRAPWNHPSLRALRLGHLREERYYRVKQLSSLARSIYRYVVEDTSPRLTASRVDGVERGESDRQL
nr:uncharacterized protein LOC109151977 [Ipomoea batatas]